MSHEKYVIETPATNPINWDIVAENIQNTDRETLMEACISAYASHVVAETRKENPELFTNPPSWEGKNHSDQSKEKMSLARKLYWEKKRNSSPN